MHPRLIKRRGPGKSVTFGCNAITVLKRGLAGLAVVASSSFVGLTTQSPLVAKADSASSYTLKGVTCVSATDCWAVGEEDVSGTPLTLIEHNAGSGWSIVSSPRPGNHSQLFGITCVTASDCLAVGKANDPYTEPLIETIQRYQLGGRERGSA
jgi:hypothetical protein